MTEANPNHALLLRLQEAGAAQFDAVNWHYIQTLSARSLIQTGPAQTLLQSKLQNHLRVLEARMAQSATQQTQGSPSTSPTPSPMAVLLQDMAPSHLPAPTPIDSHTLSTHRESPRVRQFRQQLRQISVQKRVSSAIAQAPQNAGPINSHMLVLRALGLMRDISPDYLNRFMTHVDTLLCLQHAEQVRPSPARSPSARAKK